MKRILRSVLICTVFCIGLLFILYALSLLRTPGEEKEWGDEFKKTATTENTEEGGTIIHNVRDWTYGNKEILTKDWKDVEVNGASIKKVWFLTEPFATSKAIAHTFLSFEFDDGTVLSFSIEARREARQGYSSVLGAFNEYELSYTWGTERDLVTRRLLYLQHPLQRYPLNISNDMAETLFRTMAADTNVLAEHPRFYNTLAENCTNTLAKIVNSIKPHTLPYNIAWNLPGYADLYLMDQGFISRIDNSDESTRKTYEITSHRAEVSAIATSSPQEFSATLNKMVGK